MNPHPLQERLDALWTAYGADDLALGQQLGARLVQDSPGWGPGWYGYACMLERSGRMRDSDRCFVRAARAQEDPQRLPYRVSWLTFERLVESAREALPIPLKNALTEIPVILADYAEPGLIDHLEEPEIFGLFTGPMRGDASDGPAAMIHLWRRAHEHACVNKKDLAKEIRTTLWHELGHYLGYEEDALDAMGMG